MVFLRVLLHAILQKYGNLLEIVVTDCRLNYFYQRMNFVQRASATSRPFVAEPLWIEICILFSHDICTYTSEYYIPDELVKDMDQTPTKYLATSSVTMAGKNTKLMPKQADNGKRVITANFWKFLLSFSEANWTNKQDTFRKISNVLLRTFVGRRKS